MYQRSFGIEAPRVRPLALPGLRYFFTVNLADRRATLLVDHLDLLRDAIRYTRKRHPFDIDAMVVLPDHLHAVWTLPSGDADFPLRWRLIKTWFSRNLLHGEHRRASHVDKSERGIWQRRYWEHLIRDETDLARHVDYVHWNIGEAWACGAGAGLALLDISSLCARWDLVGGSGCAGENASFGERR